MLSLFLSFTQLFSFFLFLRSNISLAFFLFLLTFTILWLLGFNFLFTKHCIFAFFKSIGVGNGRTRRAFLELRRKSFHLAGLLIPFIYYCGLHFYPNLMTQWRGVLMLSALTAFLWLIEFLRIGSPGFRRLYNIIFGSMLRKSEMTNSNVKFTGTGFFFLGHTICVAAFDPSVATCASLFLILGDMMAAIVGISFGHIKIGRKSLEGTLAMFLTCFTIGMIFFWNLELSEYVTFLGAIAAALAELLSPDWLDDNLSVPISAGLAMHFAFIRLGNMPPAP